MRNGSLAAREFRKFRTTEAPMTENQNFNDQIEEIAEVIAEIWEAVQGENRATDLCTAFNLPTPRDTDWGPEVGGASQPLPGRA